MPTSVSEQIRTNRKARGWTQKQLAQAAGCSQTTIHDIEFGYYKPTGRWIPILLAILQPPSPQPQDTRPRSSSYRMRHQ